MTNLGAISQKSKMSPIRTAGEQQNESNQEHIQSGMGFMLTIFKVQRTYHQCHCKITIVQEFPAKEKVYF